jgi:hypothetical protein
LQRWMKNFNGRSFFSLFFIARANQKKATWRSAARVAGTWLTLVVSLFHSLSPHSTL